MIQITRSGTIFSGGPKDLESLRAEYERQHYFRLPELLEPGLHQYLQRQIVQANFYEKVHEGIKSNKELCLPNDHVSGLLNFLLNSESLFHAVQQVTGCGRIGCFTGRVYRVISGRGHHDSWHSDLGEHRVLALSLNLSHEVYSGAALQIRDRRTGEILREVANTGFGDAIVFRLAQHLQHRVTEVVGPAAKTAFAGWFQSEPDFRAVLRRHSGGE